MSRVSPEVPPRPLSSPIPLRDAGNERVRWEFWVVRFCLTACVSTLAGVLRPFGLRTSEAAGAGFLVALVILLAESRLRHADVGGLLGGTLWFLAGLLAAFLISLVVFRTVEPEPAKSFLEYSALIGFGYLGLALGVQKGGEIFARGRPEFARVAAEGDRAKVTGKLLDTSALIDGRIADICEAHFMDGPLLVPQFVLRELQLVADSSDALRRQRGRRGLEVLHRMQKMAHTRVQVLEDEALQNSDVDRKLVDLALRTGAKIVTNDFNLNKVASVQGISVLNVNQLANALRPAVLPGETMRVFILREGKETNQGVAYLEDGTMVVVDGARRLINKTVDIAVTSVHQTPAGKMIFGRLEDRGEQGGTASRQAAAAGRSGDTTNAERRLRPGSTESDEE
jgi:uncharacterized protein YacL